MRAIHNKITMPLLLLTFMGSASKDVQVKGVHNAENFGIAKKLEWSVKKERKAVIQKLLFQMIFDGFLTDVFKPKQVKGPQRGRKDHTDFAVYIEHGNIENFYKLEKYTLS